MRKIAIRFFLSCETPPMESLSKKIGIEPFYSCSNFPKGSIAKPFWYTEVVSDALCIEDPLSKLKERISPRLKEIVMLCKENQIKTSFQIVIRADYADRPEITISPMFFPFFEQLNAELNLDIAYEW